MFFERAVKFIRGQHLRFAKFSDNSTHRIAIKQLGYCLKRLIPLRPGPQNVVAAEVSSC
jgi:hypothetical protein